MSEATYSLLLPPYQTELEGALAQAATLPAATDAGIRTVRLLYSADAIPLPLLPWLAWAWDVPYWDAEGSEDLRRQIVRDSLATHRILGTLKGYRRIASYAGFRALDTITPPDKTFLGSPLSLAQRNAWLRQFPQLRAYPFRSRGVAAGSHLGTTYPAPAGRAWPARGDAIARIGERFYLWRNGVEQALTTAIVERGLRESWAGTVREARLPGRRGHATWLGDFARFTAASDAARRLYRIEERQAYLEPTATLRLAAVRPSAEPILADYEWVAESATGRLGRGIWPACRRAIGPDVDACRAHTQGRSGGFVARHLADQDAGRRIYKRWYLWDETALPVARGRTTHLDATRLGLPAYHARLRIDLSRRHHRRVAVCGRPLGSHPSALGSAQRILQARQTLSVCRAERDRVWLLTKTQATIAASSRRFASESLLAGTYYSEAS